VSRTMMSILVDSYGQSMLSAFCVCLLCCCILYENYLHTAVELAHQSGGTASDESQASGAVPPLEYRG